LENGREERGREGGKESGREAQQANEVLEISMMDVANQITNNILDF